ncbi:ROK family protein [Arthrobacter sp.]|uniref:ROK family protein n=1 Tax=Arthrobacter sp. TaxID=1667 RepID=UPI001EC81160|nr:ROK family transcriptional regulator [Micrococcaceae bacterium RIT 802]
MQRGTNLGRLGDFNQAVIFASIRRALDGVSRVELAESTGLSPQTISNVVRRLLDEGLVREDRTIVSGPGKPRTVLELEANRQLAIGIHLDPALITLVMLDLRGEVIASKRYPGPAVEDPEGTVARMAEAVEDLIGASGQLRSNIVGVGVVVPGPMDTDGGHVTGPPLLDGWSKVEIVKPLAGKLNLNVILEKDTIAATIAEVWHGTDQEDEQNFVFVYVGAGIGVGMVLNGEIVRGVSNNAGEIGHYSVGEETTMCVCGRTDCLAGATSFETIARKASEAGLDLGIAENAGVSERAAGMGRLVELADGGNTAAIDLLRAFARRVADMVGQLVNVLDVDKVVYGGPYWDLISQHVLETADEVVNERFSAKDVHGIRVVNSGLGPEVAAIGGGCAVLDASLSPKPSVLLLG